jgi:hypothetical protein
VRFRLFCAFSKAIGQEPTRIQSWPKVQERCDSCRELPECNGIELRSFGPRSGAEDRSDAVSADRASWALRLRQTARTVRAGLLREKRAGTCEVGARRYRRDYTIFLVSTEPARPAAIHSSRYKIVEKIDLISNPSRTESIRSRPIVLVT